MGIVQGLVEWIPVSSEGQLIVVAVKIYNLDEDVALSLAIWLHFGTMFAVLIKYKDEWLRIINIKDDSVSDLRSLVIYSTIGTGIVAIPLYLILSIIINTGFVKSFILVIIGSALILTGILMKKSQEQQAVKDIADLSIKEKILIGMGQGLSIIPGISRSGTTVGTLLLLKVNKDESFKASFIISVPAVMGAVCLEIISLMFDGNSGQSQLSISGIFVSIIFAFLVGLLTIELILKMVRKYNFAIITVIFGTLLILLSLI
jgi:undecaprenyl-diphosphatase